MHFVDRARIADVSCVLLHYKLTSNTHETALQNKDAFSATSKGYADLIALLADQPDYMIKRDGAVELQNVNELVANGFLVVSKRYREYVQVASSDG